MPIEFKTHQGLESRLYEPACPSKVHEYYFNIKLVCGVILKVALNKKKKKKHACGGIARFPRRSLSYERERINATFILNCQFNCKLNYKICYRIKNTVNAV